MKIMKEYFLIKQDTGNFYWTVQQNIKTTVICIKVEKLYKKNRFRSVASHPNFIIIFSSYI